MPKNIEETYKKLSHHEHILTRPHMYIGDPTPRFEEMWITDGTEITQKPIKYSPGLLKVFDEVLTNALDHSARDATVSKIKVILDKESGEISVENDGTGIPIAVHKEHNVYVPELIFGHLLSSSNYNDADTRTGAGVNGLGVKLVNVFSTNFKIETWNSKNAYVQTFSDNMKKIDPPTIKKKVSKTSGTKITFQPEYTRFGNLDLKDSDTYSLLHRRIYDCIACTSKNVSMYFNGKMLKGKGLIDYTKYFSTKVISESQEPRDDFIWEYAVGGGEGQVVSFVNGNNTYNGGDHVDYILNQIASKLKVLIEQKKKITNLRPQSIKDKMFLFLRATISNPQFTSQTKVKLATQPRDFGCKVVVSDAFVEKIYKSTSLGIVQSIVEEHAVKVNLELKKKTDGTKKIKISVPKLEDAQYAGSKSGSEKCTLILTEGDSARTFAMWGRNNAEYFGVFPLKGKILNVRGAKTKQLLENQEINSLKQILGLKHDTEYETASGLRYGRVLVLTDADADGTHIKCLLVNLFHFWWPSLLQNVPGFIQTLRTPIVKVNNTLEFFTEQDYEKWSQTNTGKAKYYKGLGTSEKKDAKDLFRRFAELKVDYTWTEPTDEAVTLAFDKANANLRKEWLIKYNKNLYIKHTERSVGIDDLIHKELIHFSMADNIRSIPSLCDGLKPSQRKILFYMLKNKVYKDIKVAQLSGYISAETAYHHGEASLQKTIVTMAQDFIGKNNLALLTPRGNFGSRYLGGDDAASPRYIFTCLSSVTKFIFPKKDYPVLEYNTDDGARVEPTYYLPIIPTVLLNGCEGIGTGYSSYIPPFNVRDIIKYILCKLGYSATAPGAFKPYFGKFKGTVRDDGKGTWYTDGVAILEKNTLTITELPVETWLSPYKEFLEKLDFVDSVADLTTDENTGIKLVVKLAKDYNPSDILKTFKLTKSFSTRNMHLFSSSGIKLYDTVEEIIDEYYQLRLGLYEKRRLFIINILESEVLVISTKVKFIKDYMSNTLLLNKQSRESILEQLASLDYPDGCIAYTVDAMPMSSLTLKGITDLESKLDKKTQELQNLKESTPESLWKQELEDLEEYL